VSLWGIPGTFAEAAGSAIAQGFQADNARGAIVSGALVSLKAGSTRTVELATTDSADRLVGAADDSPLLVIASGSSDTKVVISGTVNVLVSDLAGAIKAGDKITTSPIAGVGMLATADSQVVGAAQAGFDTARAETKTVTDTRGGSHTAHFGSIPVQVSVAFYQAPGSNFLPPFIQRLANSVAGRSVSLIRILLCGFLLLLTLISITVLIYTSVRTAITSIGRNPLAARAIRRGLYQVVLVAAGILGGALLASYFILIL